MGDGEHTEAPMPGESTPDLLTLQQAADHLRVHYMTAYRWVRRGDLPAFKAGGRLRIRVQDLESFIANREIETALPRSKQRTDWPTHVERLHRHLRAGDNIEALSLVRKVIADGAPVGDVYVRLLSPALERIGDDWAGAEICVAEEHRATEIVSTIVKRHGEAFRRRGPRRGNAVSMAAPDDVHSLGAAMVADFLRRGGYDVSYLGAAVPFDDLAVFLRNEPADVVCASVTTPGLPADSYAELARTARQGKAGTIIVFGGQAVVPEYVAEAGGVHVTDILKLNDELSRLADV